VGGLAMEKQVNPDEKDRAESIVSKILQYLGMGSLNKSSNYLKTFLVNLFCLRQLRERKQLENMQLYLKTVAEVVDHLKKTGTKDKEIQVILHELEIPLIQSSLKGMMLLRHFEEHETLGRVIGAKEEDELPDKT
jgi:hypothetical protein